MSLLLLLSSWLKYQCTTRSSSVWLGSGSENLEQRKHRSLTSGCSHQHCCVHAEEPELLTESDMHYAIFKDSKICRSYDLLLLAAYF